MADMISKLPLEITLMILSQLPIPSLISYGATSKANYTYHALCMRKLHLAVFQKRVHATIAFMDVDCLAGERIARRDRSNDACSHQIPIILPQSSRGTDVATCRPPTRSNSGVTRTSSEWKRKKARVDALFASYTAEEGCPQSAYQTIRAQNEVFAKIISRYGRSLIDLEFMAYDLNAQGAIALSTQCGRKLRHLALRFEHPHIRDSMLSRSFWSQPAPGSPAWNALIGVGPVGKNKGLSNLDSLVLERAGVTPWQLRMLVKRNPKLRDLKLRTCAAAQPEFVNWLGGVDIPEWEGEEPRKPGEPAPGASIQVLWLENCDGIHSEREVENLDDIEVAEEEVALEAGLEWVRGLKGLKVSVGYRSLLTIH
jgi:hypothetical protein